MLEDFIKINIKEVDYTRKLTAYNVLNPEPVYLELINSYSSPSKSYIKSSARSLCSKDIEFETLSYIIETCHQCSSKEKYEAMVIFLHKYNDSTQKKDTVPILKQKLIDALNAEPVDKLVSFEWVDKYSTGSNEIFYLLEITIGVNKIFKYGITAKRLRQRLATIKSDIKVNYEKQALDIKVIMIIECDDNKLFEEEVEMLILENNIKKSNYDFRGHTETFKSGSKDFVCKKIIQPSISKFKARVLFDSENIKNNNLIKDNSKIVY